MVLLRQGICFFYCILCFPDWQEEISLENEVVQKSGQLGWFSYLSNDRWQELTGELEAYASLLDAA